MKSITLKVASVVVFAGVLIASGDTFSSEPHTAELAFAESSKDASLVGSMVPASCSSSVSPNPQALYIDYGASGYLETPDAFHYEPYVVNCVCGNGSTNFPVCSGSVNVNFGPPVNPRIISFTVAAANISYGAKPLLSWTSTEADYCRGTWSTANLPANATNQYGATVRVGPVAHTLTCYATGGSPQSGSITRQVTSNDPTPPPCRTCVPP